MGADRRIIMSKNPQCVWAQRDDLVYFTIQQTDLTDENVGINFEDGVINFTAGDYALKDLEVRRLTGMPGMGGMGGMGGMPEGMDMAKMMEQMGGMGAMGGDDEVDSDDED